VSNATLMATRSFGLGFLWQDIEVVAHDAAKSLLEKVSRHEVVRILRGLDSHLAQIVASGAGRRVRTPCRESLSIRERDHKMRKGPRESP
jgi:hypothetical protein